MVQINSEVDTGRGMWEGVAGTSVSVLVLRAYVSLLYTQWIPLLDAISCLLFSNSLC